MNNENSGNTANINDILDMLSKEYGSADAYKNGESSVALEGSQSAQRVNSAVNESRKYAASVSSAPAPQLHTTYVPRFTEASRSYRMSEDKSVEEPAAPTHTYIPATEPTAERYDNDLNGESANVKRYTPDPDFSGRVYKFTEPTEKKDEIAEPTVDEPVSYPPLPETPEIAAEKQAYTAAYETERKETQPSEEEKQRESFAVGGVRREFNIPGHDFDEGRVSGYRTNPNAYISKREDTPENVGDRIDSTKKRVASEYTAYAQRDSFKDMFLDSLLSLKLRFFAVLILAAILLVVENLSLFNVNLPELLNIATIPGSMALIDLQFIICIFLLAIPEVISSIKNVISGKIVPEIMFSVSFIIAVIYCFVMIGISPSKYPLFGLLFAMSAAILIMASFYKKAADFTSFKVISINGEKRIVDKKFTRTLERENVALDGIVEEHKSKTARIFRTTFVSDFFKRSGVVDENSGNVLFTLVIALGAALITGTIAFFVGTGGMVNAASAFTLVFMFACPAFACLVHKLPYFHAMSESVTEKSVVIGETSFYDYADVDVVTFNDTEVFGPDDVNLQRVMLYGQSDNLSKALRQMSAIFMNVGGPLDILFSNSLDRKCPAATDPYIDLDGVAGVIDGHSVCAGTAEFMRRNGIRFPEESVKSDPTSSDSTKVMYGAEDGEVYVKFYIRYSFSEEFSMLLPVLQEEAIIPLVYTRDPNITSDLIAALTAGDDRIRILKKQNSPINDDPVFTRLSSGIVTLGDKMNAINMILLSKKYVRLQSGLNMIETISMAVGALLSAILTLAGFGVVPSILIAVWPLVWSALLWSVSKKIFHITKKKKK